MARMASFESALEAANADSKVVEESQKDLDQRLGSLEEGGWEERLRGLVMGVNQFQQNIRQVQGYCHRNIVIEVTMSIPSCVSTKVSSTGERNPTTTTTTTKPTCSHGEPRSSLKKNH